MRESILTIPINEIFEPKCGCPVCRMKRMLEERTVEYIMGAAMMEPDVRIETNRTGFCAEHYSKLLKAKNRLSLALMLQTHIESVAQRVKSEKKLFGAKGAQMSAISEINSSCFVCEKIEWGMKRLMVTFFEMYQNDEFKKLFMEQEMLCMPHYELLCTLAPKHLHKKKIDEFVSSCTTLVAKQIDVLYKDVSHFCSMYDYRNTGSDADWGNSRNSIERSIAFLTGLNTEEE